jgi:pyruvate,water dikinase
VAIRPSPHPQDLLPVSVAGRLEAYLGIRGGRKLLAACRRCFGSVFTDRAIAYRIHQGVDHLTIGLAIGVQRMVRADLGVSGVMFTSDQKSGFRDMVLIKAAYGLGEAVVQERIDPDAIWLVKPMLAGGCQAILKRRPGRKDWKLVLGFDGSPTRVDVDAKDAVRLCLSDAEAEELARAAVAIERHYGRPMDIVWAKDGETGLLYVLEARPEQSDRATPAVLELDHKELVTRR